MKKIIEEKRFKHKNIDKKLEIFDDNTGKLSYINPKYKIKVCYEFSLKDNKAIDNYLIDILGKQFIERNIQENK